MNLGEAIKGQRKLRGLPIRELARQSATDGGHICNIESGKKIPSPDMLKRICEALDLEVDMFDVYVMRALFDQWRGSTGKGDLNG